MSRYFTIPRFLIFGRPAENPQPVETGIKKEHDEDRSDAMSDFSVISMPCSIHSISSNPSSVPSGEPQVEITKIELPATLDSSQVPPAPLSTVESLDRARSEVTVDYNICPMCWPDGLAHLRWDYEVDPWFLEQRELDRLEEELANNRFVTFEDFATVPQARDLRSEKKWLHTARYRAKAFTSPLDGRKIDWDFVVEDGVEFPNEPTYRRYVEKRRFERGMWVLTRIETHWWRFDHFLEDLQEEEQVQPYEPRVDRGPKEHHAYIIDRHSPLYEYHKPGYSSWCVRAWIPWAQKYGYRPSKVQEDELLNPKAKTTTHAEKPIPKPKPLTRSEKRQVYWKARDVNERVQNKCGDMFCSKCHPKTTKMALRKHRKSLLEDERTFGEEVVRTEMAGYSMVLAY